MPEADAIETVAGDAPVSDVNDSDVSEGSEPAPLVVAVDFTADTLRIALAEPGGHMRHRDQHALPPLEDEAAWAWEVGGRISTAFAALSEPCFALAIGVACPGPVHPVEGRMLESDAREEWAGLSVVEALRRHFNAPVAAVERTRAALRGETMGGAAEGAHQVLYAQLGAHPRAAIMVSGRIVDGGGHRAGELPVLAALDADVALEGEMLETVTEVLTDATALLDPSVVVLHGPDHHVVPLGPVLQAVLDEIVPGVQVVPAALGDDAALLGALQVATVVAYEGERTA